MKGKAEDSAECEEQGQGCCAEGRVEEAWLKETTKT